MMARPASGMWSKPSTANASIRVLLPEPGPPVMTWKSGRSAIARTFRFRVERALAPPLPERQHIASVVALNARCTIEQRAVKGGAIIVGQLDQTGFLDEAAQLYEMARALASGHDPSSRIGAARGGFKPVPCLRPFALRLHRCRQCVGQPCDRVLERRPRPASATPPFRSAEHTSELQSLMRNSYADVCLK